MISISNNRKKIIIFAAAIIAAISVVALFFYDKGNDTQSPAAEVACEAEKEIIYKYGLPIEEFVAEYDTIGNNQTLAEVLYNFGFSSRQIYELTQCPDSIFNERKIRPGQVCAILKEKDSTSTARYFVFEESAKRYVTFDLAQGYKATCGTNPSEWREREIAGIVRSSLWHAMEENGASPQVAVLLSHIFGWSIDFFGIQKGDEFRVIYAQEFVEEKPQNDYRIIAASFRASDSTVYAIPFTQDGEELFYNTDGNSLEGAFLKAPLDFYRITSKFSNSRMHPVLKRRRAHHGVDYAAPVGTPVYAIGNGKVIAKGYQPKGGGNYVKIRHNGTYTTTYMHLSKFAKGLKVGDAVKQKQVIGYVGSTGLSTGPHLDFRVYENGKAVNPLTIKSQPKKPVSEANREEFRHTCDSLVTRLRLIPQIQKNVSN